jgi:2'-5' RNA ligase
VNGGAPETGAAQRLFVAIALDEAVAAALADAARAWLPRSWRATPAAKLHLTLRFLGATPAERVGEAVAAVAAAAGDASPFALRLDRFGAFPNAGRARVAWIGAAPEPSLEALAARVERAVVAAGFAPDERRFAAHVTVGRLDRGARRLELPAPPAAPIAVQTVGAIALFRSETSPAGSRYVVVGRTPLGPAGRGSAGIG